MRFTEVKSLTGYEFHPDQVCATQMARSVLDEVHRGVVRGIGPDELGRLSDQVKSGIGIKERDASTSAVHGVLARDAR